jgi:hypothetical protein
MSDAGTSESKAKWSRPWLVAGALPLAVTLSMPLLLSLSRGQQCPPETFYRGTLGVGTITAGLLLLVVASLAVSLLCFLRAQARFQAQFTWVVPLFYLSGGVALLGLLFCAYGETSWFCATSRDVLVHPSLFKSTRSVNWADVRVVSTSCETTKYNHYGGLVVRWADKTELYFPLVDNGGVNRTVYEPLAGMMAHRQYDYRMSDVASGRCPAGAPGVFTYFHR